MKRVNIDPTSIAVHSEQSDFYKYRTPYIPQLFERLCVDLKINKDTSLMDLGCGRGEVSQHLSKFAGLVHGVDGSQEMINLATPKDNICYQVTDLNQASPKVSHKADHLFFGRSIHWFPAETLQRLASDLLKAEGKLVVCSTQWSPVGEWGPIYSQVKDAYAPKKMNAGHDFTGQSNLGEAGFSLEQKYSVSKMLRVDTEFMVGHTFSTAYSDRLQALISKSNAFENEMTDKLKRFNDEKKILLKVTSWAYTYSQKSTFSAAQASTAP